MLLRGNSTLTSGERETIASFVSHKNDCNFCYSSHGAAAAVHLETDINFLDDVKNGFLKTELSEKMKSLLTIANRVQEGGRAVTENDIIKARDKGATDLEIHDTVLIAAAFCMYNRYVDGLASFTPADPAVYEAMGERMAKGYVLPPSTEDSNKNHN